MLLFGKDYWERLIDFDLLVEESMINQEDLAIFQFVDDEERAWEIIRSSLEKDWLGSFNRCLLEKTKVFPG